MISHIKNLYNKFRIKKISQKKNTKKIFSEIYKNNYWGDKESASGPGSNDLNTKNVILNLKKIIKKYKVKSIVDAPCGDFYWVKKVIQKLKIRYLGLDIVDEIIEQNTKQYTNKRTKFSNLDIIKNKIPDCDLIICRDFIFHLSNRDIMKFFKNLNRCKFKYILISNHSYKKHSKIKFRNKNINTGDFRKINIFEKPFNFSKNYLFYINDYCDKKEKYLIFFSQKDIKKAIKHYIN